MAEPWDEKDTGTSPRMAYRPPERPRQTLVEDLFHSLNWSVPFNINRNALNDFKNWEKDKKAYDQDYEKRKAKLRAQSLANKAKPKPSPEPSPKPSPKPKVTTPPMPKPGVVPKTTQTYPVKRG
jgi:hypothetical protein